MRFGTAPQKLELKTNFWGDVMPKAKYSEEFKLKVVQEYLNGPYGYRLIANKYAPLVPSQVRRWVSAYKAFGRNGLAVKKKDQVYSVQFKLNVLNFMKQTGASLQETAIQFDLNDPNLVSKWKVKFSKEGIEGLERVKGWPTMPKKTNKTKQEIMSREEQLEREVELLRLEVAYLKKLRAFRENPKTFLEKHKQPLPSSLKKKDSD